MANRTARDATTVHGSNPQYLIEKILRQRIYDSAWYKANCFALGVDTLVDKAIRITYIGGFYGANSQATPFISLLLKMLALQPSTEQILLFLSKEEFKYVRCLAAFYVRLVFPDVDVYKVLEPLLADFRKLKFRQGQTGSFEILHVDEFVDQLLREDKVLGISMRKLVPREVFESQGKLEERTWEGLSDDDDEEEGEEVDVEVVKARVSRSPPRRSVKGDRLRFKQHGGEKKRRVEERVERKKTELGISIEETNAIRAKAGLAPLDV